MRNIAFIFCLSLLLLAGCKDNIWRGEVASINGRPITLDQVAALRNSTYFDWTSSPMAEIDEMRKQYGDALTNLLVVELVKQQLEKKKLAVTAEEVTAEENIIRADYPSGTFEDTLVSEAIDLEMWRFLLHNYLSVQRFLNGILRADITILPEEVDAYLRAHPKDFIRPPWAYFFLVSGADAKDVAACANNLKEVAAAKGLNGMDALVKVQESHPDAVIRRASMDIPRLDPALAGELGKLSPGELSPGFVIGGEHHQVLLLESLPERQADSKEAYRQIEEILTTQKMHVAYNEWVLNRLKKANIKVSKQLLPHLRQESVPQSKVE